MIVFNMANRSSYPLKIELIFILLFLMGPADARQQITASSGQPQFSPPTQNQAAPKNKPAEKTKDLQQDKKKLKLMIITGSLILGGFFLAVILISALRFGRRYRRRIQPGQHDKPTEYVDAWSQYRLKEDDQAKEQP